VRSRSRISTWRTPTSSTSSPQACCSRCILDSPAEKAGSLGGRNVRLVASSSPGGDLIMASAAGVSIRWMN
jgi:hypothetical protein